MRQAEAVTFNEKTIPMRESPSTSAVFEEFIHVSQNRRALVNSSTVTQNEIDAARKLIQNARAWNIPPEETAMTQRRLEGLQLEER